MTIHRMRCGVFAVFFLGLSSILSAQAPKIDVALNFSRLGPRVFYAQAPSLNGWQASMNVQRGHFLGIEGDLSHYGMGANASTPKTTMLMVGPRLTVSPIGLSGLHLYVHGLVGGEHSHSDDNKISGGTMTVAFGAGGDVRVLPFLSLRLAADWLAAPTSVPTNATHRRSSIGVVVRF
jgi:hypothetical protein